MTILFVILITLAAVVLALFVLIQNPKGGGLAGNIAGFSTQFMGVKQTTDVLEKGTWIFAGLIAVLCLVSSFFMTGSASAASPDRSAPPLPSSAQPATQNPATPPANTLNMSTTPDSNPKP